MVAEMSSPTVAHNPRRRNSGLGQGGEDKEMKERGNASEKKEKKKIQGVWGTVCTFSWASQTSPGPLVHQSRPESGQPLVLLVPKEACAPI